MALPTYRPRQCRDPAEACFGRTPGRASCCVQRHAYPVVVVYEDRPGRRTRLSRGVEYAPREAGPYWVLSATDSKRGGLHRIFLYISSLPLATGRLARASVRRTHMASRSFSSRKRSMPGIRNPRQRRMLANGSVHRPVQARTTAPALKAPRVASNKTGRAGGPT